MGKITFEKVKTTHKEIIFSWLAEPHVQEFWDNTKGHKDDILNFMEGRKTHSSYCGGNVFYWVAKLTGKPFAMLMTGQATSRDPLDDIKLENLSKTGHTYGIDYMIGNKDYFGKGHGAKTLIQFIKYFQKSFDEKADTFLIDPVADNPKAKHVYEKAGFKHIADFVMGGDCSGSGKLHHLLIKKLSPIVILEQASLNQYPMIQNMTQLYVYDASKQLGFSISEDGL